jgi:hypothetical protein
MKKILLLTILLFAIKSFGQDENLNLKNAKADFEKLSADYETKEKEVKTSQTELNELLEKVKNDPNSKYSDELTKKVKEVEEQKKVLNSFCKKYENYKAFYSDKGVTIAQINEFFKHECTVNNEQEASAKKEYKTYLYYGDDLIIEELKPTGDKKTDDILKKILSSESESYLGDIIIPKENQEFYFYKSQRKVQEEQIKDFTKRIQDEYDTSIVNRIGEKYKFKSISFDICEGFFIDIKVLILDENNSEHLFENRSPISVLNYSNSAPRNFIFYKHPVNQLTPIKYEEFENLRIRLSDVLTYISKPGYNYIPNDVTFNLPTKDEKGNFLNKDSAIKYEIKESTTLQNVIELRAYTDFLGLFTESPNGIVQFQGKGDFYIFPFKTSSSISDVRLLDKISPYVNFSRIDDDVRGVETTTDASSNIITVNNSLDLLQKAYLQMGTKLNLINIRFTKAVPFRIIGYFPARYQIADIKINNEFKNIQGLGLGLGATFEFKRFNNFGFNYSLELSKYSFRDFNSIPNVELPSAFSVFQNEAEVFYYPGSNKKQAIFLRLKTFNNSSNNEAFYQLQFGYRFSIGVSEVKAKAE